MTPPKTGDARVLGAPAPAAVSPREPDARPGEADRAAVASPRRRSPAFLPAPANGLRLAPWHRRLVIAAAIGLAATGLLWMAAEYGLGSFPELDDAAARSRMHALLMIHGVLGYAGAVLFGSLLGRHIPAGLRSGRRTATGLSVLGLVAALLVTALLLYYAGSDPLRRASSAAHQGLGVAAIAAAWIHIARRERPRRDGPEAGAR